MSASVRGEYRRLIQQRHPVIARGRELLHVFARDWFSRRQMQRFKITVGSVLQNPEIKMRTGGETRHPDKPDALAGVNVFADVN
jgi:hypothetical protein